MINTIYKTLKTANLNPKWPGVHKGYCTERYCIVKHGVQVTSIGSDQVGSRVADIILYLPATASYPAVERYMREIKATLKHLPIRYAGETPVITDDEKKAYTTSVQYQIFKTMEG